MRAFALAALAAVAVTGASAQTSSTPTKSTTTTPKKAAAARQSPTLKRPVASVPHTTPVDPKANEGVAAVGTMPAVTGTPVPLFTLKYVDLKVGDGELGRMSAPPDKIVFYTVHYTGWTTDGKKFDSSVDRGEPIVIPIGLKRVITGWDAGFEGMHVGGKRRLIIPWQLAYGEFGRPPVIPAKADLIFDIELVGQGDKNEPVTGTHFGDAPVEGAARPTPAAPAQAARPEAHQE